MCLTTDGKLQSLGYKAKHFFVEKVSFSEATSVDIASHYDIPGFTHPNHFEFLIVSCDCSRA